MNRRFWLSWPVLLIAVVIVLGGGFMAARSWYNRNLAAVSSSSHGTVYLTIISGSTVHDIAVDLKRADLIRSTKAFEAYVRGRQLYNKMQAGTYAFSKSMSTPQIVSKIVNGEVSRNYVTILPGKTLTQIKQAFKEAGYSDTELDTAFDPATYAGHPLLASAPAGASLEGLLYPDSFEREASTPASTIIRESLDEMQKRITPDIISGFSAQGLNEYQGITLASVVYAESGDATSQPTVAQVFLLRLKQGMALGSDVTAFYAAGLAGQGQTLGVDSPYNTRIHTGLPPGPIGTFNAEALKAVAQPSATDYLYFVAGDDGSLHFSHTEAEHEQAVKQYCTKECS
jgi:UPF0755 protein